MQDCSTNSLVPAGVRINTFRTIIQMAFTTNGCSVLVAAQCTHIHLLPNIILRGSLNKFLCTLPNVRGYMFPQSVGRVTDLPPDAELRKMQQNSYILMQLIGAATPNVPNQTPMPQMSEQLLNSGPIPSMHIIIALLPCGEPIILPANEWHNDMQTAFVGPIMAPDLKIKKLSSYSGRSITIPYQHISGGAGGQGTNPYYIAQHINGNSHLINMTCVLWIPKVNGALELELG